MLNPFVLNASFLYPLKTSENLTVFRGYRKGALGTNGLNFIFLLQYSVLLSIQGFNTIIRVDFEPNLPNQSRTC